MKHLLRTVWPVVCVILLSLSGCSFIHFSANYYTLPIGYHEEIMQLWEKLNTQIPLQYDYKIRIVGGQHSNRLNGVPAISNRNILLPEDFVKYVYQNYYDDRFKIFSNVIIHEVCHAEFDLASKPVEQHYETDIRTIQLLGGGEDTPAYLYKSLFVVKNYWFARKGVLGHTLNVAWNALSLVSKTLGGPGFFVDWYATDLNKRMAFLAKQYNLRSKRSFRRTRQR